MNLRSRSLWTALVVLLLVLVPVLFPGYHTSLATLTLIYALLAMSVDVLAGFAGRTPLCHGAIFGAATYVVMYYVTSAGGNPWIMMSPPGDAPSELARCRCAASG